MACFCTKGKWSQLVVLSTSVMLGWEREIVITWGVTMWRCLQKNNLYGEFLESAFLSLLKEVKLAYKLMLQYSVPVLMTPPASSIEIISCYTIGILYRIPISSENCCLSLHTVIPLVILAVSLVGHGTNKNDPACCGIRRLSVKIMMLFLWKLLQFFNFYNQD